MKNHRFLSTYQKDYIKKKINPAVPFTPEPECADPISEGFKNYLVLEGNEAPPPMEDAATYLEKFKNKGGKVGEKHFKEPLEQDIIYANNILKGCVTEYKTNYCDIVKDIEYYKERRKKKLVLNDDIEIPITTNTSTYRDPSTFYSGVIQRIPCIKQPNSLGTNEKLNEILKVHTGVTEYMDVIAKLGSFIIEEHNMYK